MPESSKRKLFDQPQEVINRWFRIKVIKITRPYIEGIARRYLRIKLKVSERQRKKALQSTFNTIVRESIKAQKREFHSTKEIFNISLFFLLAERDIQALKVDALTHPDKWQRNLSLRVMLLVMHEWDMSKVAPANKMNNIYENAGISQELRQEMAIALRTMNKAQNKARKLLSHIRHSTIAHRDADALYQYKTISSLDAMQTLKILASFYEAVDLFNKALPKLMLEASQPMSLIQQYGKEA
ncbi:MAG: hypothetical protein KZQ93_20265 [Candidatus Thiodiazotropha sp. (ex Monitilora ramsayi)]|nr:hypothetical protein [Candidatus Thiodiazotropha sp. (ex Monitilora ramsayi)]